MEKALIQQGRRPRFNSWVSCNYLYIYYLQFFFNVNKRVEENEFQVVPNDLIPYKYKIIYCLSVIVLVVYINIEVILVFYEQGERKH